MRAVLLIFTTPIEDCLLAALLYNSTASWPQVYVSTSPPLLPFQKYSTVTLVVWSKGMAQYGTREQECSATLFQTDMFITLSEYK